MTQNSLFEKAPQALPALIGVAVTVLMVVLAPALLNDPDSYWHIATGRWVMDHWAVPHSDPFSHTMPGGGLARA